MKKSVKTISVIILATTLLPLFLTAQNVGINAPNPTEPLQVGGMIYSSQDGFKFPDGSVQTRAMTSMPATGPAALHGMILCWIDNIPGPFNFQAYNDVVRALSFEWGVSRIFQFGGGGGTQPPMIDEITVLKEIDRTSVFLLEELFTGSAIDHVEFYFLREDTVQMQWENHLRIRIENVRVSGMAPFSDFAGGEDYRHLETVKFTFEDILFDYDWEISHLYIYQGNIGN
jgi:type VI protein secretion system component Hcp